MTTTRSMAPPTRRKASMLFFITTILIIGAFGAGLLATISPFAFMLGLIGAGLLVLAIARTPSFAYLQHSAGANGTMTMPHGSPTAHYRDSERPPVGTTLSPSILARLARPWTDAGRRIASKFAAPRYVEETGVIRPRVGARNTFIGLPEPIFGQSAFGRLGTAGAS